MWPWTPYKTYKRMYPGFLDDRRRLNLTSATCQMNRKQLKMGEHVELEHTSNPLIARRIAADHLKEFPDYYTRLGKMEREAKSFWKKKCK